MSEAFCVIYRDLRSDPPRKKLSCSYESLEQAVVAASEFRRRMGAPMQIRGTEGTVIEKAELERAIGRLVA
jgi:hypothetical protein